MMTMNKAKTLLNTIKQKTRTSKGESLIETIASLLLLTIIFASITSMVQVSIKYSDTATQRARENQEAVNPVVLQERDDDDDVATTRIFFVYDDPDGLFHINVSYTVDYFSDSGFVSFTPNLDYEDDPGDDDDV
jgi:Tfp pilus assembly protein PilV